MINEFLQDLVKLYEKHKNIHSISYLDEIFAEYSLSHYKDKDDAHKAYLSGLNAFRKKENMNDDDRFIENIIFEGIRHSMVNDHLSTKTELLWIDSTLLDDYIGSKLKGYEKYFSMNFG